MPPGGPNLRMTKAIFSQLLQRLLSRLSPGEADRDFISVVLSLLGQRLPGEKGTYCPDLVKGEEKARPCLIGLLQLLERYTYF